MARSPIATAIIAALITGCFALLLLLHLDLGLPFSSRPASVRLSPDHGSQDPTPASGDGEYLLGVGKADITGPVVEINLMGYADMDQLGSGLRQRLYCRAFIVGDRARPNDRFVYLVLDTQSGDTAIRRGILEALRELGGELNLYSKNNVAVTGTHSHAGPGAWLNYLLPQITSKGFDKSSYQAIVDGSVLAIRRAHESLAPGHLSLGAMDLDGININRSPYAYEANPEDERSKYSADVDKIMTLLRFDRSSDGKPMGILSWFAVHGTSLYGNNTLISGDNKGVAAHLFERSMASVNPTFVAGFSQANVGDTTPNVLGAFCEDTGLACRHNDSTCGGNIKPCRGRGPYFSYPDRGTKSCFEIGRRQFLGAKSIFSNSSLLQRISVPGASTVSSLHTFVNLTSYSFPSPFNSTCIRQTCSAALGHSFAGGTTDGPGAFDFKQGTTNDTDSPSQRNPLWKAARAFVHEPSPQLVKCQEPKPILLDVGSAKRPYAWAPNIVDIQLLRVGNLILIVSPGEATTMSGRRWRGAVAKVAPAALGMASEGEDQPTVVLGGPANSYTHYIATEEEYGVQRYEGASTLYGPHTLEAYINLTLTYLPYLGNKDYNSESSNNTNTLPPLPPGPNPPINTNKSLSFITPVILDRAPLFHNFGDVLSSPSPPDIHTYRPGEIASTRFVAANPRNNHRLERTFAAVEKLVHSDDPSTPINTWRTVRTDADWHLVLHWQRTSTVLATSEVTIDWEIEHPDPDLGPESDPKETAETPDNEESRAGLYRIRYYGDAKSISGTITPFEGVGGVFRVEF